MSYTYKYPRPAVTADVVAITKEEEPKVLLIQRGFEPYKGCCVPEVKQSKRFCFVIAKHEESRWLTIVFLKGLQAERRKTENQKKNHATSTDSEGAEKE